MSLWAEKFGALSRDVDRSDTSRHIAEATCNVSRSVHSVAPPLEPVVAATWPDACAEHATTVEHHCNVPRIWTEGFAGLHPDRPHGDVPLKRWLTFIDDVRRFFDDPICAVAAALGWGAHDLFGCDRNRPFARIDQAGLLCLLNGDRVIVLTTETAVIEKHTGTRQTWHRKAAEASRVLVWELLP